VQNATWLSKPLDFDLLKSTLMLHPASQPEAACRTTSLFKPDASHIQQALENDEFFPLFQPKMHIADGKVIGCEALARWNSPHFGEIPADLFIPVAEQARLIKPLTIKLLETSLLAAKQFIQKDPSFVLAANLSASLLSDIGLPEEIEKLLADNGFPTSSLILEITESVAMSDVQLAMDVLLRLRIRGIGISMDDFGTGYSSLSALARMPFTEIKIDRSFVSTCLRDDDMWKIVRGAVVLGHELKLKVVAEGVEDRATQQALKTIGCDIGQGYYFSPALSAAEFLSWWDKWNRRPASQKAA
jgi:EAL domain-containing protein (putative c-di-GMP-specific phosphodiesterase class I)